MNDEIHVNGEIQSSTDRKRTDVMYQAIANESQVGYNRFVPFDKDSPAEARRFVPFDKERSTAAKRFVPFDPPRAKTRTNLNQAPANMSYALL